MNAKACKRIRRTLRDSGIDPRQTTYEVSRNRLVLSDCGRAVYQGIKRTQR